MSVIQSHYDSSTHSDLIIVGQITKAIEHNKIDIPIIFLKWAMLDHSGAFLSHKVPT